MLSLWRERSVTEGMQLNSTHLFQFLLVLRHQHWVNTHTLISGLESGSGDEVEGGVTAYMGQRLTTQYDNAI